MDTLVNYEKHGDYVAIITLNRLKVANALSKDLLDELNQTILEIKNNDSIRSLIITGEGEKAFCAGADLKERKGMTDQQVIEAVKYIGQTIKNIEQLSIPTVAAINGAAFGGGLELALACDLRIASNHAKMGLTETSLGIIPGAGGTQRLTRLIGLGKAKQLIYTAEPILAKRALEIGLIEQLVTNQNVVNRALDLANKIAKNAPVALKQAKIAIHSGYQTDLETGLKIEELSYQATIPTKDRREGLTAFKEKREPNYQGE